MTMLFGSPSTPWSSMTHLQPGQQWSPQPAQQIPPFQAPPPIAPYPTMQQPQQQAFNPTPPAAPGADLAYSNNLAQQYASQLQNQSIPGGYQPAPQPVQQAPVVSQTPVPQPTPQTPQQPPAAHNPFHALLSAWQAQRPMQGMGGSDWRSQIGAWRALRPNTHPMKGV